MENRFQAKYFFILGVILIIIGLIYLFTLKNPKDKIASLTAMTGSITEIKDGEILVLGFVGGKDKIIELIITPETIFKKTVIGITESQAKSGKPFAPKTEILSGKASDLAKDMLVRIKTTENLLSASKTKAVEINYTTYDFPF